MKLKFLRRVTGFWLLLPLLIASGCVHSAQSQKKFGETDQFDYAWLKGQARHVAESTYQPHEGEIPQPLKELDWDEYQEIRFNHDESLWKDEDSLFRAQLFHLGLYFNTPISIYELNGSKSTRIPYDPDLFEYGKSGINGKKLPKDLGYAGFRFHYHTDWQRDVLSFLGASYFRAVGGEMQYGLSARGLAIDTASPKGEEFPVFTHFWLQKPAAKNSEAIVYALMDSPSVTGAYRFTMRPGSNLIMDVDVALYPRKKIERLGVAPLTSMFMIGENDRRAYWDWRPEIHDSDGLLVHTGNNEWIWRPLTNPETLQFNAYVDRNPKGFGLMQRDQNFDHYQDDGVFYEKRPSLWVEPRNDWGEGSVQLVEIPTLDETFDNIVAFWNPKEAVGPGKELLFSYRLNWGTRQPQQSGLATAVNTFTGIGGVIGKKRQYYSRRFVVEFKGGQFPMMGEKTEIKPVISTSAGKIELPSVRPQHQLGGYRVMFDVVPTEDQTPITLRVFLEADGHPLTETWLYQWVPPAKNERELFNAGHLK